MSVLSVDIPTDKFDRLRQVASTGKMSVEQAVSEAIDRLIDAAADMEYLKTRAGRGCSVGREQFLQVLDSAPDVPPIPGDELPD